MAIAAKIQRGHGIARVLSHGLGLRWYNAVTRPPTAGLTGPGTAWDVCTMRRGLVAVDRTLKSAVIGSCSVNSGDMALLEPQACRLTG